MSRHVESPWSLLLAGMPVERFFKRVWTKSHCHLPGPDNRFDSLLNWDSYRALLARSRQAFNQSNFRVVRSQRTLPFSQIAEEVRTSEGTIKNVSLAKVQKHLQNGSTVVLKDIRAFSTAIDGFARAIESVSDASVSTNVYHTPASTQGFPPHFDSHDVFVLQLEGRKQWEISGFSRRHPTRLDSSQDFPLQEKKLKKVRVLLKKGDIMYLPRGLWHSTFAGTEPSLHLSVGIHLPTGVELLEALISRANEFEKLRRDLAGFRKGELRLSPERITSALSFLKRTLLRSSDFQMYKSKLTCHE